MNSEKPKSLSLLQIVTPLMVFAIAVSLLIMMLGSRIDDDIRLCMGKSGSPVVSGYAFFASVSCKQ